MDNYNSDQDKFTEGKKDDVMIWKNSRKLLSVLLLLVVVQVCYGQDIAQKNNDFMRSHGRIYVVIAVMLTILAGLILFLVRLEKKITKLEKEN